MDLTSKPSSSSSSGSSPSAEDQLPSPPPAVKVAHLPTKRGGNLGGNFLSSISGAIIGPRQNFPHIQLSYTMKRINPIKQARHNFLGSPLT